MQTHRQDQLIQKMVGKYTLTQLHLGSGQFGEVVLAKSDNQQLLACKIMARSKLMRGQSMKSLQQEIGILQKIDNPNVISLYDIQETANNFYLFMQFCNGGDLEKLLDLRTRFTEKEARFFLSQVVNGFKSIHEQNVMHRDLKLANILINFKNANAEEIFGRRLEFLRFKETANLCENVEVVIADLGFAKELNQGKLAQTQCGTPLFMAPEILNGRPYDSKVDVWSLGTIFYEMLTGFVPFTGRNQNDLKRNVESGNYMFPKGIKLSLEGLHFLNQCLQYDPSDRISLDDLVKLNYLQPSEISKQDESNQLNISYRSVVPNKLTYENLNEENSIPLNSKNGKYYERAYLTTIANQFGHEQFQPRQDKTLLQRIPKTINKLNNYVHSKLDPNFVRTDQSQIYGMTPGAKEAESESQPSINNQSEIYSNLGKSQQLNSNFKQMHLGETSALSQSQVSHSYHPSMNGFMGEQMISDSMKERFQKYEEIMPASSANQSSMEESQSNLSESQITQIVQNDSKIQEENEIFTISENLQLLATGKLNLPLNLSQEENIIDCCLVEKDGLKILCAITSKMRLLEIDLKGLSILDICDMDKYMSRVYHFSAHPDFLFMTSYDIDSNISFVRVLTGGSIIENIVPHQGQIADLIFVQNAGTKVVLTSCTGDQLIRVFVFLPDSTLQNKLVMPTPGTYVTKFMKHSDSYIVCGLANGSFSGWDLNTNTFQTKQGQTDKSITAMMKLGDQVFSGDSQGTVQVTNLSQRVQSSWNGQIDQQQGEVVSIMTFENEKEGILTACKSGQITYLNPGQEKRMLVGHPNDQIIKLVKISASQFISVGSSGLLKKWSIQQAQRLYQSNASWITLNESQMSDFKKL